MNLRAAIILAVCALLAQSGCDKNPLGIVESRGHPPVVSRVFMTPSVVIVDTMVPDNGVYHIKAILSAKATDPDGISDLRTVQGDIVGPDGAHVLAVSLLDNGAFPDSASGDGIYTASVNLPVTRGTVGNYYPFVTATDGSSLQSSSTSASLLVISRTNSPPRLSNLTAPDTVTVAIGETATIPMTVVASDSNGLADIKEVFFLSLDSSNPTTHFQMKDDGGANGSFSGDAVAGDGTYSIVIQLVASSSTKPSYRFQFQARDAAGDTSASLLHTITITTGL